MDWNDAKVVVIGAGRSGVAAARLLRHLGARVVLTDARQRQELAGLDVIGEDVELALGGHPETLWKDAGAVVVSPGVAAAAPPVAAARERGLPLLSEIELAGSLLDAPVVAVTGSNGKSTVTSMVSAILTDAGFAAPACGNIGTALSGVVLEVLEGRRQVDLYVVELSSFQTEAIERFRPHWAAVLNVSADHLDRHADLASYTRAKLRIAHNCTAHDWLVYGADDTYLAAHLPHGGPRLVPFGTRPDEATPAAWIEDARVRWRDAQGIEHDVVGADDLEVVGAHNLLNAAAASALACLAGASPADARSALTAFHGLEHRMESCGAPRGVLCINDSKATNVGATVAALGGLHDPVWLILGGRDKGADFGQLRSLVRGRVRRALLIGEAAGKIAAALDGAVPLARCDSMERAVDTALADAEHGDVLLLAPACTSFDQYRDFEHRGRHFKQIVADRVRATEGN